MVSRLATALDLPLRQHNALLLAAGFSASWRQTPLASPALAQIARALDLMLAQHEPFPPVVVDRHWTLVQANAAAWRLMARLVGPLPPGTPVNLADALLAPDVLRPWLTNWAEVARHFVRSVESDVAADGSPESDALLARLLAYDGVQRALGNAPTQDPPSAVLPMAFRKGALSLRLFTTITTLGTPQDITLQELRIESFFPFDDATAAVLREWASAVSA
jgi:hypothetical protein